MEEESIVEDETETSIVKDDDRQAQPPIEQEDNEGEMSCTLFRACDRCTETESLTVPECQMGTTSGTTGRIVTFRCTIITHNNNNNDRATRSYIEHRKDETYYYSHGSSISDRSPIATLSSSSSSSNFLLYHYESCRTTQNESEFNYIQFQVFICLIGLISIYSIRKQKMLAASLFDQRRMTTTTSTAVSTAASSTTTTTVSRTNSNASHSRVIQRSNTGVNSSSGNNNSDGVEMKPLLLSSGSSNMSDMDIV